MGSGFRTPTAASGGFPLCLLTLLAVPAKEQVTRSPQGDGSHVKLRPHRVVCGSQLLPPGTALDWATGDTFAGSLLCHKYGCECNDDTYTSRVPFTFFLSGFKVKHVLEPLKVSRAPGPRPAGPNGGASPAGRLFKSPRGPEPRVTQLSGHVENRLRWHHRVSGQGRPVRGVQRGRQDLPRGEGRLQPLAGHR